MKHLLLLFCSLVAVTKMCAADSLLTNGNFDMGNSGWENISDHGPVMIAEEAGKHYLAVTNSSITAAYSAKQTVDVKEGQWIEFSGKIRTKDLKTDGQAKWHNARVQTTWADAYGKSVTPWPPSPSHDNSTGSWVEFHEYMLVPAGAKTLDLGPGLFYSTGEVHFSELSLKTLDETEVPEDVRKRLKSRK